MERYKEECKQLGDLAKHHLNLPKNRVKENFEDMTIVSIYVKLMEEVAELQDELLRHKPLDKVRVIAEIGDCAGMLAGIIAKLKTI